MAVDLGKVNEDYFANVAAMGLSVEIASNVTPAAKHYLGRLAYALTGAWSFLGHRAFRIVLEYEGHRQEFVTHQIVFSNGRFHGGRPIEQEPGPINGQLGVLVLGGLSRWQLFKSFVAYVFGVQRFLRETHYFSTEHVKVETMPRQALELDGEIAAHTPAVLSAAPRALKVIVPQQNGLPA